MNMEKAFDPAASDLVLPALNRVPFNPVMGIQAALEWAFGREFARIEFDDEGAIYRDNVDTIWQMMRRGDVGCQIDGGGRSRPHEDAEVIAEAVSRLPVNLGGRQMAVTIACHARAGTVPDWMPGAVPRLVPREWQTNRHGRFGKSEVLEVLKTRSRGKLASREVRFVPCMWMPTAGTIASMRRGYMEWRRALFELSHQLGHRDCFSKITLTRLLPPIQPWAGNSAVDK